MNQHFQNNSQKRHKLVSPTTDRKHSTGGIDTVESLKEHLQIAIQLEHSTIPPYLCALYSIKEGTNHIVSAVIRSVVVEEMLHMVLAANVLNAIGGTPIINTKNFIPDYPDFLPHSNKAFKVGLEKFSKKSIETFLKIEKPAEISSTPQAHDFNTIGQFYKSIRAAIEILGSDENGKPSIFTGEPAKQITPEHYYGSGGKLIVVDSLKTAIMAIDEIIGQGEGIDGTIFDPDDKFFGDDIEYAHYFRFNEILHEQFYVEENKPHEKPSGEKLPVEWASVYNMKPNPKMKQYCDKPDLFAKAKAFNITYMALLNNIHEACNGKPELLMKGVAVMYDLKYKAVELMKTPVGDGDYTAGPSFEYIEDE